MKKTLALILAVLTLLALASCGNGIKVEQGKVTETNEESSPKATVVKYPYKKEDANFVYVIFEDSVTIAGINGEQRIVEIPSEYDMKPVTSISKECDMTGVTSITIPESVTEIADSVFANNETLTSVLIESPITVLANDLFSGCTALQSVTLPQTLTAIGLGTFEGCASLSNIEIPASVTDIGESAFKGCSSLQSVTLTSGMTTVENFCFKECTSLASIVIPDNIVYIGQSAFEGCTALSQVTLPEAIAMIDQNAFASTPWLDSFTSEFVIVGDGNLIVYKPQPIVIQVETTAASTGEVSAESTAPAETKAPETVTTYPSKVAVPDGVKRIMGAFAGHEEITSVSIPDSVIEISTGAFKNCTGIESLTIPESVKSFGESAFEGCKGLRSLNVPASVEVVRDRAFAGSGLRRIVFGGDIVQIGYGIFEGLDGLTVVCPDGSDMMSYCQYNNIEVDTAE